MKYLLIFFIVALALAPLTHFLPSKRQRKVAGLREYAAVHGLFVEFRNLPGSEQEAVRARTPRGDIIYYGKRLPPPRRGEARRGRWVRDVQSNLFRLPWPRCWWQRPRSVSRVQSGPGARPRLRTPAGSAER